MMDDEGGVSQHCVRTIHAEQNAICQAARHGTALEGATLYCTMEPCRTCAMLIVSVGITRVVADRMYHAAQDSREIFRAAIVDLVVVNPEVQRYDQQ
jgi:dCMP deaminase